MLNIHEDYHIHCNYNDHSAADLTVENIIKKANRKNLQKIAITEHVRKTSNWAEKYLEELDYYAKKSEIKILKGFEAKILPDGDIDCPLSYLNEKFFIISSFHTKHSDKNIWYNALIKAIRNENVNVIGHLAPDPGILLNSDEIKIIGEEIVSNNKTVEINAKYMRPPMEFLKIFKDLKVPFHLGSDAHSLEEIGNFDRIKSLINFIVHCGE